MPVIAENLRLLFTVLSITYMQPYYYLLSTWIGYVIYFLFFSSFCLDEAGDPPGFPPGPLQLLFFLPFFPSSFPLLNLIIVYNTVYTSLKYTLFIVFFFLAGLRVGHH